MPSAWQLLRFLRPYRKSCVLIELCILAEAAYPATLPLGLKRMLEADPRNGLLATYALILVTLAGLFALSAAGSVGREHFVSRLTASAMRDLRASLHARLLRLPASYYAEHAQGDLLARLSGDSGVLEQALKGSLPRGAYQASAMAIGLPILCLLDFRLALATAVVLPCAVLGPRLLRDRALRASQAQREREGKALALAQEHLAGQAVIRAFGLEGKAQAAFEDRLSGLASASYGAHFTSRLVSQSSDIGATLSILLILASGGWLLSIGAISVASLVAFGALLVIVCSTMSGVASMAGEVVQASGSARRVAELLNAQAEVADEAGCHDLPGFQAEIALEHVSFGYTPDRLVLEDLTFRIPAGERVALVGRSGAGKSTLLSLLLRFYDPASGSIALDGHDVRSLSQSSLREHMAVVFQENYLFDTSLRENIRLGKLDASDAEVERAGQAAQLDEVVAGWPEGYDSLVGERGQRLSGGQRQRVALARALVRRPAIVLLDEPTASLDPATEANLQDTLEAATRGRTVISATHRLLDMDRSDRILVLDHGRLVEQGSHEELLASGGAYAALWQQQHRALEMSQGGRSARIGPEHLRDLPLFSGWAGEALAELAARFRSERVPAGRTLYATGDPAQALYLIAHGSVELLKAAEPPCLLEEGDFFGEDGFTCEAPRDHAAVVRTPTLLLTLAADDLRQVGFQAAVMETASRFSL